MSDRRVFVTGASGFVGNAVVPELVRRGFRVRALRHRGDPAPGVSEIVDGTLADVAAFAPFLDGVAAVVHCAALLDPVSDEALADRINHRATLELAERARERGVGCFVFSSSFAAVGSKAGAGLVVPDAPCDPSTAYGRSKLAAEWALARLEAGTMRIVMLRPPTVYGPGERRNFLALVRAIDTGYFAIPGKGENRISFCAARNLAHAVGFCIENPSARGIVHVADEPVMTFRESVTEIARALGRRILPLPFPLPVARAVAAGLELGFRRSRRSPPLSRARLLTLTADCALDTSQNAAIGLVPVTRFRDGVEETIEEYRAAGLVRPR